MDYFRTLRLRKRQKVFCIGRNKTGTTSIAQALRDLGYEVGDQSKAERLIHEYKVRNFQSIVNYCKTAQAFQDIPFSLPYTFQALDFAFPSSKFILTVRDNEDVWYQSLIRFQKKRLGATGKIKKEHLQNDPHNYRGFMWDANRIIYTTPEEDPYNEKILKSHYLEHNKNVCEYFRFRDNFIVLNLNNKNSYLQLCAFLEVAPSYEEFPWLNKSS